MPWKKLWSIVKENRTQAVKLEKKLKNLGRHQTLQFMMKYKDGVVGPDELHNNAIIRMLTLTSPLIILLYDPPCHQIDEFINLYFYTKLTIWRFIGIDPGMSLIINIDTCLGCFE